MPDIGRFHPQIVHFVVALLFTGLAFRWLSFIRAPWLAFTGPAAAVLLVAGATAAALAVHSGLDAHGPVERVPGARAAVVAHEEWGERTRNIFLVVAALEIAALVPALARWRKGAQIASALVGLAGGVALYEAGEHGGDLVYAYAGGVGIRSGDPADVGHLLVAGLYHQAMLDRKDGRAADAARLIGQMAERYPDDTTVRLLAIESLLLDQHDSKAALAALKRLPPPPPGSRFMRLRTALLLSDAYAAVGLRDSARAVLEPLSQEFATNRAIQDRLAKLR